MMRRAIIFAVGIGFVADVAGATFTIGSVDLSNPLVPIGGVIGVAGLIGCRRRPA